MGVLSAGTGLFVALLVGAVALLFRFDFYRSASTFLKASDLVASDVAGFAVLVAASLLAIVMIAVLATFGGMIIYLSSSPRSYLSHVWRGALVPVVGIALFVIARGIMSLSDLMG